MNAAELGELKAAVDMYSNQYNATDKLWAYFSTVTLAVLGFSVASNKVSQSFVEASVVAIGYFVFCLGNFNALYLSHRQLIEFATIARSVAEQYEVQLAALKPLAEASVRIYYWTVVIAVIGGILYITWHRSTAT